MLFINENLKTKLTVKEDDQGGLLFDLYEVANNLGYDKPKRAIQDFYRRNSELFSEGPRAPESELVEEWVLYLFLMESNAARAKEFKIWVCQEVLPAIRKVGLKAVKELELTRALHTREVTTKAQALERYDAEVVESVLASGDYYRVEGFLTPSDIVRALRLGSLEGFYKCLITAQILSDSGELLKPELGRLCTKWHNSYTSSGKWYSWKPEVLDLISTTPRASLVSTRDLEDWEEDLDLNI